MSGKARLGAGDVEIVLDGETVVLRPSLKAAQAISRAHGGIRGALNRVADLDVDVITSIIGLGMNRKAIDIEEAVYRSGFPELVEGVTNFILVIANGGRPPKGGEGEENPQTTTS